jgi:hypothetical protein
MEEKMRYDCIQLNMSPEEMLEFAGFITEYFVHTPIFFL